MASAMIEEPANEKKLALIRRFLVANGNQAEIDSGSFLQRLALPGGALSMAAVNASKEVTFEEAFQLPMNALLKAYEPHRKTWQQEYETHVNWEFEEEELLTIVEFLESASGAHFLEGRWRMGAYIGTNTEGLIEQIVAEAETALISRPFPKID